MKSNNIYIKRLHSLNSPGLKSWAIKRIAVLLFCILLNSGCEKAAICDCFKGTGDEITETRTASPFNVVDLNNKVDLHVHRDSVYRITVTSGKKLINNITTTIEGGILKIDNENKCNWVRDFQNKFSVHIYVPSIQQLEVNESSGNIYFEDTMISQNFLFESWGSTGDYHLKLNCHTITMALQTGPASLYAEGDVGVAYLWNSGGGRFDALKLKTDDIYATNIGMNDVLLYPEIKLEGVIEFSGNIYYKGSPSIQQFQDNGSGEFIQL